MYCSNCGMRLPDEASFCVRCGAKVVRVAATDPLERIGLDDTSAVEPLWDDDAEAETQRDANAPDVTAETQLMEPPAGADEDASVFPGDERLEPLGVSIDAPLPDAEIDVSETDEDPELGGTTPFETPAQETRAMLPEEFDDIDAPAAAEAEGASSVVSPALHEVIDVGEDDGWGSATDVRAAYEPAWEPRARRTTEPAGPSMALVAVVAAAAAIIIGFLVAFRAIGGSRGAGEDVPLVTTQAVSASNASDVIGSLDGWWKTARTLDGRHWRFSEGKMETYAADGQLAEEVEIDALLVERMTSGPGEVEGAGYYLRDIAYYLTDDDPDTLHAIGIDGAADPDANLYRIADPTFVGEGTGDGASDEGDGSGTTSDEYMLPESSTRVYDASELEGMSDHDLFVARNEIYARHGYVFDSGELGELFGSKSWYTPSDSFNEGEITEIERQNVSTILSIEQARGSQYV